MTRTTLPKFEGTLSEPIVKSNRLANLNEEEERALKTGDVGAMYSMGIHPVIINGYCRAMGYRRADYRELLENKNTEPKRKTRWQTS